MNITTMTEGARRPLMALAKASPIVAQFVQKASERFQSIDRQIAELDKAAAAIPAPLSAGSALDTIRAALESGSELPDLVAVFAAERALIDNHEHVRVQLAQLRRDLAQEADQAAANIARELVPYLSTQLTATLTRAGEAWAALRGVDSAESAIDAGRVDEWSEWFKVRADYQQIRDAHRTVILSPHLADQQAGPAVARGWDWCALVSNAEVLDEQGLRHGRDDAPAWVDLAWLVQHPEAEPWLPNLDQIITRLDALAQARAELAKGNRPALYAEQIAANRHRRR